MKGRGISDDVPIKYKGVRQRRSGKWVAEVKPPGGRRIWLGTYDRPEDAARVYDVAARRYCGTKAKVNFMEDHQPVHAPHSTPQVEVDTELRLGPPGSAPDTNMSQPGQMLTHTFLHEFSSSSLSTSTSSSDMICPRSIIWYST